MPKTKLNGPWPGVKQHGSVYLRMLDEPFVDEGKKAHNKGSSGYDPVMRKLIDAKPGSIAVETPTHKHGRAFVHAVYRYLKNHNLEDKYRPALKQVDGVTKIWLLGKEQ